MFFCEQLMCCGHFLNLNFTKMRHITEFELCGSLYKTWFYSLLAKYCYNTKSFVQITFTYKIHLVFYVIGINEYSR